MLAKYFKNNISIEDSVENWEVSIEKASIPLLNKGYITNEYIEKMKDLIKKLGFFVVLTDYIAMPHARPEFGVNNTSLSLLKLNNPVQFGDNEIYLIFILAAKNNDEHIELLTKLSDLLQDDNKIKEIIKAKTIEEIEKII